MSKGQTLSDHADLIVPIGRRIYEILLERGISRYAFSQKIGWQKDTFYSVTDGKRHLPPNELEDIAAGLKIDAQRLKQEDIRKQLIEIRELKKKNPKRVLVLGRDLLRVAIGYSEKFDILLDMGSAHYFLKNIDEAHSTWLQALPYAEKLRDHFGDTERLYKVMKNLMITYSIRKDFLSLVKLLDDNEPAFAKSNPERAGVLSLSYAMYAYKMGSMEQYKEKMYESFDHFQRSGNARNIARATHNIGFVEYQMGNYLIAKQLFESVIGNPHRTVEDDYGSIKEYVKTLLKLGEREKAKVLIEDSLEKLNSLELHDVKAKFLLLHAETTNCFQSAEEILNMKGINENLHSVACKFLVKYFSRTGDSEQVMKYVRQVETYSSEFIWEEV